MKEKTLVQIAAMEFMTANPDIKKNIMEVVKKLIDDNSAIIRIEVIKIEEASTEKSVHKSVKFILTPSVAGKTLESKTITYSQKWEEIK